jgi:drug/metabolite transporter superfamily protein YnfA
MGFFKRVFGRMSIFGEFLAFLWKKKLWWLIPMAIILIIVGLLLIFAQSSSLAPFIYTLF